MKRHAERWLLLANVALGLALLGAALAPVLRAFGYHDAARAIHTLDLILCPQRPDHSYFLLGYQTALEHREIAMLAALLVGGIAYGLTRPRGRRVGFSLVALSVVPMLWDVLTQMWELRDSDWQTRTWTAALFSLAYVFWLYPVVDRQLGGKAPARTSLNPAI